MNNDRRKRIDALKARIEELLPDLEALRDEEREACDALPDGLRESERGQQSEAAADALDEAATELESIIGHLDTATE